MADIPRLRERMEQGYLAAVKFGKTYGVQHYNLGLAESCDDDMHNVQAALVARLLGDTVIGGDTTLVDVGSGIGGALYQIAATRRPRKAIGIEFCMPNIQHGLLRRSAESEGGRVAFVQADAQSLPLPDESVDVVFNLESAFHYPDKTRFMRECARVVRKGGRVLIGDLARERWIPQAMCRSQGAWFWTQQQYRDAFAAAGLRIVSDEEVTPLVINSIQCVLKQLRQGGIRQWWPSRRSVIGVWGAGWMLRSRRLRYLLFRAEK